MSFDSRIEPILQFETFEEHLNLNDCYQEVSVELYSHYLFAKRDSPLFVTVPKGYSFLGKCEVMYYCELLEIEYPPEYQFNS